MPSTGLTTAEFDCGGSVPGAFIRFGVRIRTDEFVGFATDMRAMRVQEAWALAPALAPGLWGGMYVVSKWGFDAIPPVTLAFCRVALGAAVLLLLVRVRYPARDFSRRDWLRFGALGLVVAVSATTCAVVSLSPMSITVCSTPSSWRRSTVCCASERTSSATAITPVIRSVVPTGITVFPSRWRSAIVSLSRS